jgi:predicted  nucleic acid-binding Zn-ribbon protein
MSDPYAGQYGDPQTIASAGESTSALLRRAYETTDQLAAEISELRRERDALRHQLAAVLEERDELKAEVDRLVDLGGKAMGERDQANELTDKIAAELRLVTRERDSLARRCAVRFEETQALKAELEQLRYSGWQVARDGGRQCTACAREIRRGEAYSVNTTDDTLRHVFCPAGGTP